MDFIPFHSVPFHHGPQYRLMMNSKRSELSPFPRYILLPVECTEWCDYHQLYAHSSQHHSSGLLVRAE